MAKDIAQSINNKLKEKAGSHPISYIDIRNQVVDELNSRNQNVIAASYSGYRKIEHYQQVISMILRYPHQLKHMLNNLQKTKIMLL
jgi:hypothetical protein